MNIVEAITISNLMFHAFCKYNFFSTVGIALLITVCRNNNTLTTKWFIGEIIFFFDHQFQGNRQFLVLVKVAEGYDVATYDKTLPVVTMNRNHQKLAVCRLDEIDCTMGLVKCNTNGTKFKVVSHRIFKISLQTSKGDNRYL